MGVDLLKHNQEAYEKVKEILRINNKTCVIQPTEKYLEDGQAS